MNFDEAIQAHANWKMKLTAYINKPDKSVSAATLAMDNQCVLGKWLYGEGAKYASLPEYQELKKEHALFHRAASEIVKKADAGEKVIADVAVGAQSEYNKASIKVTQLIMKMKTKAGA